MNYEDITAEEFDRLMAAGEPVEVVVDSPVVLMPSIMCPVCSHTSHNSNDVREGYCGNCHDWTTPRH